MRRSRLTHLRQLVSSPTHIQFRAPCQNRDGSIKKPMQGFKTLLIDWLLLEKNLKSQFLTFDAG
jgi:hypothetical protein